MGQVIGWGLIYVFSKDFPTLGSAEIPQGQELGLWVLVLIASADSGVEGDFSLVASPLQIISGAPIRSVGIVQTNLTYNPNDEIRDWGGPEGTRHE
jgi:hypothetical protein